MSTDPHADRIFVAGPDGFRVACGCSHVTPARATRSEAMAEFRAHLPQPTDRELAGRILAETPLDSLPAHLRPGTCARTGAQEEGAAPRSEQGADATTTGELTSHVADRQ